MASRAATALRSCCRSRPRWRPATSRIYKLGGVALPLAVLFGTDALAYRLQNSGAAALITNARGVASASPKSEKICPISSWCCRSTAPATARSALPMPWRARRPISRRSTHRADDPAMMVYTSGTTGQPKGALHGHRVLIGHLPGVETHHDFFPQAGDRIWTPADWAWAGGLLNVLLPGLHYGVPVVARRFEKFDPEEAFALMARAQIRNAFIPPTALRMLRAAPNPKGRHAINMRIDRLRRRVARARKPTSGENPRSASSSTNSMARPNATSCSRPAVRSACPSPAPSASRSPATRWR